MVAFYVLHLNYSKNKKHACTFCISGKGWQFSALTYAAFIFACYDTANAEILQPWEEEKVLEEIAECNRGFFLGGTCTSHILDVDGWKLLIKNSWWEYEISIWHATSNYRSRCRNEFQHSIVIHDFFSMFSVANSAINAPKLLFSFCQIGYLCAITKILSQIS